MKVHELAALLNDIALETPDYDVSVAFRWKEETVVSGVVSLCFNGQSIQLNEEAFEVHLHD